MWNIERKEKTGPVILVDGPLCFLRHGDQGWKDKFFERMRYAIASVSPTPDKIRIVIHSSREDFSAIATECKQQLKNARTEAKRISLFHSHKEVRCQVHLLIIIGGLNGFLSEIDPSLVGLVLFLENGWVRHRDLGAHLKRDTWRRQLAECREGLPPDPLWILERSGPPLEPEDVLRERVKELEKKLESSERELKERYSEASALREIEKELKRKLAEAEQRIIESKRREDVFRSTLEARVSDLEAKLEEEKRRVGEWEAKYGEIERKIEESRAREIVLRANLLAREADVKEKDERIASLQVSLDEKRASDAREEQTHTSQFHPDPNIELTQEDEEILESPSVRGDGIYEEHSLPVQGDEAEIILDDEDPEPLLTSNSLAVPAKGIRGGDSISSMLEDLIGISMSGGDTVLDWSFDGTIDQAKKGRISEVVVMIITKRYDEKLDRSPAKSLAKIKDAKGSMIRSYRPGGSRCVSKLPALIFHINSFLSSWNGMRASATLHMEGDRISIGR